MLPRPTPLTTAARRRWLWLLGPVALALGAATTLPAQGYANWAAATITDPVRRTAADDADGNGRTNLVEYALGLAPSNRRDDALPRLRADGNDLYVVYARRPGVTDASISVQTAPGPAGPWASGFSFPTPIGTLGDRQLVEVKLTNALAPGGTLRAVRLAIQLTQLPF